MNLKKIFNREKKSYVLEKGTQVEKFFHCVDNVNLPYQGFTRKESYILSKDIKVEAVSKAKAIRKMDKILNKLYKVEVNYSSEGFYEDILLYEKGLVHEI